MDATLQRVVNQLQSFDQGWAVCGGWAIDLFLNRQTRAHKDLDVAIKRCDQLALQAFLLAQGWALRKVSAEASQPWEPGDYLQLPVHIIFCSHGDYPPDYLEILLSEASDTHYKYRRNPAIQLPLARAFLTSESGIPILAPEIVLLFKAKGVDAQASSQQDFDAVLPALSPAQRAWLKQALSDAYGAHRWVDAL